MSEMGIFHQLPISACSPAPSAARYVFVIPRRKENRYRTRRLLNVEWPHPDRTLSKRAGGAISLKTLVKGR
jgi:hypothetical protein